MPQILPYRPLPEEIVAAISTIDSAHVRSGLEQSHELLAREGQRRAINAIMFAVTAAIPVGMALGLGVSAVYSRPDGQLLTPTDFVIALAAMLSITLLSNLLRSRTMADDMKVHLALMRWGRLK